MNTQSPTYRIVIPARYASTRFPGKVLHKISGIPMILRVAELAQASAASSVLVATDHADIQRLCEAHNLDVQMTSPDHPSGTDRIREVAMARKWADDTIIVGLQGDEPATPPAHLDLLASLLADNPDADMATLCTRIQSTEDYLNPDRVKVVRNERGYAMYFSRAPIPYWRDSGGSLPESYLHIGLYAYRCEYLKRYGQLTATMLEETEQLEQLRVLHHGGQIQVAEVEASKAVGVDRIEDVARIERYIENNEGKH